jgi:hypothetical protein
MSAHLAPPRSSSIVASIGRVEGRRLIAHPIFLAGVTFALLGSASFVRATLTRSDITWDEDAWTVSVGFMLLGVLTMVAANHAALRDRREHTREQHSTLPVGLPTRTGGLLAALLWPTVVAVTLLAVVQQVHITEVESVHLLEGICAISLLGALGVAMAAWLPNPFVAPVVAWAIFLIAPGEVPQRWHSLTLLVGMQTTELALWHLAYLAGLAALFGVVAVAKTGRSRPLLVAGLLAAGFVMASGTILLTGSCPSDGTCRL